MEISYRNVLVSAFETLESDLFENLSCKGGRRKHRRCVGDTRLAELRVMLDCFGLERSKMQKVFHDAFLSCCAQHIYAQDPDVDMEEVCQRNNWEDTRQQVLCLTPRRFGKTTAVSSQLPIMFSVNLFLTSHSPFSVFLIHVFCQKRLGGDVHRSLRVVCGSFGPERVLHGSEVGFTFASRFASIIPLTHLISTNTQGEPKASGADS